MSIYSRLFCRGQLYLKFVLFEEFLRTLQGNRSKSLSVFLGDSLRISEGPGKELSERKRLKGIIQMIGTEKILEIEPDDQDTLFSVDFDTKIKKIPEAGPDDNDILSSVEFNDEFELYNATILSKTSLVGGQRICAK